MSAPADTPVRSAASAPAPGSSTSRAGTCRSSTPRASWRSTWPRGRPAACSTCPTWGASRCAEAMPRRSSTRRSPMTRGRSRSERRSTPSSPPRRAAPWTTRSCIASPPRSTCSWSTRETASATGPGSRRTPRAFPGRSWRTGPRRSRCSPCKDPGPPTCSPQRSAGLCPRLFGPRLATPCGISRWRAFRSWRSARATRGSPWVSSSWCRRHRREVVWDLIVSSGALPVGLGARDTLRLEAGLPLYGHELGLDAEGREIPILACPQARGSVSLAPRQGPALRRPVPGGAEGGLGAHQGREPRRPRALSRAWCGR